MAKVNEMETYRFQTTVTKEGQLQLDQLTNLAEQEVEVLVFVRSASATKLISGNKTEALAHFLQTWRGFLDEEVDVDDAKLAYLQKNKSLYQ